MATKPWQPVMNTFLSATEGSYRKAFDISTFLDTTLFNSKADADILVAYNHYHPIHLAYVTPYNTWDGQINNQVANTESFINLLAGLTAEINLWDAKIAGTTGFAKGSTAYKNLLPHGHTPFINGEQAQRLEAVTALSTNLTGIAALAPVKVLVDAYLLLLNNAFNAKNTNKNSTVIDSTAVEAARVAMCIGQYWVLGALMQKYAATPTLIEAFFDVAKIRTIPQTEFTGTVLKPLSIHNIVRRTLAIGTNLRLKNNGNGLLQFYLSAYENGAVGATFVTIAPHAEEVHPITELGDEATMHFLNVFNPSTSEIGSWELEIM